jgi:hypothetical protein
MFWMLDQIFWRWGAKFQGGIPDFIQLTTRAYRSIIRHSTVHFGLQVKKGKKKKEGTAESRLVAD